MIRITTSAADHDCLEVYLGRSTALCFRPATAPTLSTVCSEADNKLFAVIVLNPFHLLHLMTEREGIDIRYKYEYIGKRWRTN